MKFYLLGTMRTRILMQLVLLTVVFVFVSNVGAEPVTFRFEGTLTQVDTPLQGTFSTGDSFSGTYTFDSDSPENPEKEYLNAISAMSFSSGAYVASASNGNIDLHNVESFVFNNAFSAPISGSLVGDFVPKSMFMFWSLLTPDPAEGPTELGPTGLILIPYFDPSDTDNPPFFGFSFLGSNGQESRIEGGLVSVTVVGKAVDGLVAHWPLDEGSGVIANDVTGNGFDGVLTRGPVWQDKYLSFDGIDDYVDVGPLLDLAPGGNLGEALTLAGWVYSQQLNNCRANDCRIISNAIGTAEQDHAWMLSTIKVGNQTRLRFRLRTFDGNGTTTSTLIASSGDLTEEELFHAAATYDGTTMRLYKNGVEVGAQAKAGRSVADIGEVWIGGNPNVATSRPWKGLISDVRVYNKALTNEELYSVIDELE
jgi:hypothetical protein